MVLPFVALLLTAALIVLILALTRRARERAIARRVDLIAGSPLPRPAAALAPPVWQAQALDGLRAFFAFRMRRRWGASISPLYLLAVGAAAGTVALLGSLAFGISRHFAALGATAAFYLVPRVLLIFKQRRAAHQFAEELPDVIDMIVRIVRAGLPVGVAMRTVAQEATPPASTIFAQVANQAEIGVPLDEALARTAAMVGDPDFGFLAVAVALQQSTGGNLAETLEILGQIIRKRRAVRLKAYAATSEVRMSAAVLAAIPLFVTGALMVVAPDYLDPLFTDPRGNVILGTALFGLLAAGLTMRAMIRHALSA